MKYVAREGDIIDVLSNESPHLALGGNPDAFRRADSRHVRRVWDVRHRPW